MLRKGYRFIIGFLAVIVLLVGIVITVLFARQDSIVQEAVRQLNQQIKGELVLEGSHISLLTDFPNISIDLEGLRLFEERENELEEAIYLKDTYLNFDLPSMLLGNISLKSLLLSGGSIRLIQHADSSLNLANIFTSGDQPEAAGDESGSMDFAIEKITLDQVDIIKVSETNDLLIEIFVEQLTSSIGSSPEHIFFELEGTALTHALVGGDTTFFHDKHIKIDSRVDYSTANEFLLIEPSKIVLETAEFDFGGSVDFANDAYLDLKIGSKKRNFDLLTSMAPPELNPVFARYDNGGDIFFESEVKGKSANGNYPSLYAYFGCNQAFVENKSSSTAIDELNFRGSLNAPNLGDASTMEFTLRDFSARPEAGNFSGVLNVKNFDSPDIEMQLNSQFNLDFLADFLEITDLEDLSGDVSITMNFHDIIDLDYPEKSIGKLNESYFTSFEIRDLSFRSPDFHVPISDLDLSATVEGHEARIDNFSLRVGNSDLRLSATVSDLPAILHHSDIPVISQVRVHSDMLDLKELTTFDSTALIDEKVNGLNTLFTFKTSARAFTESPYLPLGEFFIDSLFADFQNYPHTLHDFHADVMIDSTDFRVIDFSGMIDESDFHFDGRLSHYDLWFQDNPRGDTRIEFDLISNLLQLEDLFAYGGENYVPEDYRHEEFRNLKIHGHMDMHFDSLLVSSDLYLDRVGAQMKVHPMRFEDFAGRFHLEENYLTVTDFTGKLGNSDFVINLEKNLSEDSKDTTYFSMTSSRLDFDQIFNYNPPPAGQEMTPADHEDVFNIFDLPFEHAKVDMQIDQLNYHRYLLKDFTLQGRMLPTHFVYLDTFFVEAAGGRIFGKGYFNGSNPDLIYLSPDFHMDQVALDQLMFKFENFGQDYLVSDNLVGQLSADISGKIHVHPDLVPILNDSELTMDVLVTDGQLKKFALLDIMADYFRDKNLNRIRFDTLKNTLKFSGGVLEIPRMDINSSVGYYQIEGTQSVDFEMDYLVRIPLEIVTAAARDKLFGKSSDVSEDQIDEIQYRDENKKVKFINIRVKGTSDTYDIQLGK